MFKLFETLRGRVEMVMTEADFGEFRKDLLQEGLTLREVERVPHVVPESVP